MNMTEQERNTCQVSSAALTGFSRMCLLIFITTPSVCILMQGHVLDACTISLFVLFLLSAFFIAFRSWHIYFDAMLLRSLGHGTAGIGEIDLLLLKLFKKDLHNVPLNDRIEVCFRLTKGLFIGMGVHVLFYIGMLYFLFKTT
jgi:hypothetical protein